VKLLSDKYLAGFVDGDGSISVQQGRYLWLEIHQQQKQDGVIELARDVLAPGNKLHVRYGRRRGTPTVATRLVITGQKAVDVLCRIKPHLVVKRARLNRFLRELEFTERVGTDSTPVHPARKWLAGYFDADGCISASVSKRGGTATMRFSIDAGFEELEGLYLVQKAFGGDVYRRQSTGCYRWMLRADAGKALAFLGYFAKHLVIKREQAYFVLGCAAMGHFRDGRIIDDTLKAMKQHPHRLNDLTTDVDVTQALSQVRNLQKTHRQWHAMGHRCRCGSDQLFARGLCNPCYQAARYYLTSNPSRRNRSKRQSEVSALREALIA
jgi:hypothetical protein